MTITCVDDSLATLSISSSLESLSLIEEESTTPVVQKFDFPRIKYGFGDENEVNDSNEKLYSYRKDKLNKQGIEAARNPFDIPEEDRETAECYEQFMKNCASDVKVDNDDFSRVRRKLLVGSYSNSSVDEDKLPTVMRYVWKGKVSKLKDYINNRGRDYVKTKINNTDNDQRTALHFAASWGDDKMMELLLSIPGIDINASDIDGKTSLRKAVEINSFRCVKLLISNKAKIHIDARDRRNPYEYALHELGDKGFEIISYLYRECGMYSERKTLPGRVSYLHQLCLAKKDLNVNLVAEELLLQGAFANPTEGSGKTPLILAAERGKVKLVQTLLQYYPDIMHVDMNHKSAIDYTAKGSECYNILKKEIDDLIESKKAVLGVINIPTKFS